MSETLDVEINVTQEDIDNAVRGSGGFCPIALACKRMFSGHVVVCLSAAILNSKDVVYLPESAQKFITAFDKGKPVSPFSFKIKGTWQPAP